MFDEPDEHLSEAASDPAQRAREKTDELSLHAELAAVFEGPRKFDAALRSGVDAGRMREIQQTIGRLEKSKSPATGPVIPPASAGEAAGLLALGHASELGLGDYHLHRRPGEVMIVRWLAGEQVEAFYERLQAHFDVALRSFREEERSANEWKQDPATLAYLDALDAVELRQEERYLRQIIRKHRMFVLSTLAVDEMDILHLCDYLMGVPAAEVVGEASAPPEEPTEQDRSWFFKLFSLRGVLPADQTGDQTGDQAGEERMCFFTYLQKTTDDFGSDW